MVLLGALKAAEPPSNQGSWVKGLAQGFASQEPRLKASMHWESLGSKVTDKYITYFFSFSFLLSILSSFPVFFRWYRDL